LGSRLPARTPDGQEAVIAAREGRHPTPWLGIALDRASNELLHMSGACEEAVQLIWETL
jgi:hypothetical protein